MSDLTKRELLAGMAMTAFCANPSWDENSSASIASAAVDYADALLAELEKTAPKPVADNDGWIAHKPGDPMPCDGALRVYALLHEDGVTAPSDNHYPANCWSWQSGEIIAWRPAR